MPPIDAINLDFSGNIAPLPVRDKDPSVKIEFRFMSSIKGEVERIIKEGSFNFRTASDFYRRAAAEGNEPRDEETDELAGAVDRDDRTE